MSQNSKVCKHCGMQIPMVAKLCPHCQKSVEKNVIALGCLIFVIVAVIAFTLIPYLLERKNKSERNNRVYVDNTIIDQMARDSATFVQNPKAKKIKDKHPTWEVEACVLISKRKIQMGFTKEQVLAAWGNPERTNRTVTSRSEHVQMVYGSSYVYLDDGIVTAWQD